MDRISPGGLGLGFHGHDVGDWGLEFLRHAGTAGNRRGGVFPGCHSLHQPLVSSPGARECSSHVHEWALIASIVGSPLSGAILE